MNFPTCIKLLFISTITFGQSNDQKILTIVSQHSQFFVWRKPIPINTSYFHVYQDSTVFRRRTGIINYFPISYQKEIYGKLRNHNVIDWENQEFQNKIFREKREKNISLNAIKKEFRIQLTKDTKKKIRLYNRSDSESRPISYLSRPLYTNDLQYAIIQINTFIGNHGGGGKILLFKFTSLGWLYEGNLNEWVY
jgi:hypothetical protein